MAKKREFNVIRTSYLEYKIAHLLAAGFTEKADILGLVALEIGAPIDRKKIEAEKGKYVEFLEELLVEQLEEES